MRQTGTTNKGEKDMAKLKPPNNTKMTKMHYEWLAWSIRHVEPYASHLDDAEYMTSVGTMWADECKGTNPHFNRDRFISAVVNGEW